jgi:hypothetical protein
MIKIADIEFHIKVARDENSSLFKFVAIMVNMKQNGVANTIFQAKKFPFIIRQFMSALCNIYHNMQ